MSRETSEPTRDELLAMAYADGELPPAERAAFEARLAEESELRREIAALKKLEMIARQVAPPEPMDHEWERIERGLVHRAGIGVGFLSLLVGATGLLGWAAFELAMSELGVGPKILVFALLGGFLLLFAVVLRNRLRTLPLDPYTEVRR